MMTTADSTTPKYNCQSQKKMTSASLREQSNVFVLQFNVLSSVHGFLRYHLLAHPPLQPGYRRPGNRGWHPSTEAWRTRQTSGSRTGMTIQCMGSWINLPPLKLTIQAVGTCLQNLTHSGVVGGGVRALGPSRARISAAFPLVKPWRGGKKKGCFKAKNPHNLLTHIPVQPLVA